MVRRVIDEQFRNYFTLIFWTNSTKFSLLKGLFTKWNASIPRGSLIPRISLKTFFPILCFGTVNDVRRCPFVFLKCILAELNFVNINYLSSRRLTFRTDSVSLFSYLVAFCRRKLLSSYSCSSCKLCERRLRSAWLRLIYFHKWSALSETVAAVLVQTVLLS
jgi:hypothetical protein